MSNTWFQFKQFTVHQDRCAMKVTTDACLFGAWVAQAIADEQCLMGNGLDIGTGTGLLSLMLAQKNPSVTIDAIEIDEEAAKQAKENTDASPWKDQVSVLKADVRKFIFEAKYDFIISNPPFYENELRSPDHKTNLAHHEGLPLTELAGIIKENLSANGQFFLLLPFKRNIEIKDLLLQHELAIRKMTFVRQSYNHDYFRIMLMGELKTGGSETMIDEISIRDDQQKYTREFIYLVKDYYLHL